MMIQQKTLTVDSDGLELPEKYQTDRGFVIRTPRVTINSHSGTKEPVFGAIRVRDWNPTDPDGVRNPKGLENGGMVGLKIYGEDQEWYPVEIEE